MEYNFIEREARPGEQYTIAIHYTKTGEKFKIIRGKNWEIEGRKGLLKLRLELWVWLCDIRAFHLLIQHLGYDPMLTMACEIAKSPKWIVDEVVYPPNEPGMVY